MGENISIVEKFWIYCMVMLVGIGYPFLNNLVLMKEMGVKVDMFWSLFFVALFVLGFAGMAYNINKLEKESNFFKKR